MPNELSPFKEYRLSEESKELRRLIWICQMKKGTLRSSTRKILNLKRDEQFEKLESTGMTLAQMANKFQFYECFLELVGN